MAAGHNSHSSWFNSLVTLTTRELESQENDYLVQQGIPWYHQQATSAAASPYLASLHGAFTPAIFETPHSRLSHQKAKVQTVPQRVPQRVPQPLLKAERELHG